MPVLWACLFVRTFQLLSADSPWNLYHKQDEGKERKTSTFSGSRIICKTWTTANRTQSIKLTINMLIRGRGWEWPELTFNFELCVCPQIFVNMITKPACIIDNSCMIWLHFEKTFLHSFAYCWRNTDLKLMPKLLHTWSYQEQNDTK